jgi:hypothetical protein
VAKKRPRKCVSFRPSSRFETSPLSQTSLLYVPTGLNFLHFYPALEENPFRACTSFENGVAVDRLPSFQINGGGLLSENRTAAQLSLMANARFAIAGGGGNGAQSLVLQFQSDPNKTWAACCDTNNCEEKDVESVGGVCGTNQDCASDLVCLGGFCSSSSTTAEKPTVNGGTDNASNSNSFSNGTVPVEEEASEASESNSKGLDVGWAAYLLGATVALAVVMSH